MATRLTNATWANLMWPISANGASPFGIVAGDSREYPVSTLGYPEYFTATDHSLFLADGLLGNYPSTFVFPGGSGVPDLYFMGTSGTQNNLPDFYMPQLIGQTVTTDTNSFTMTSDAYASGQNIGSTFPSYVLTVGNLVEVS